MKYLILVAVLVLAGCQHALPPKPEDALFQPMEVEAVVLEETIGDLFIEADGLWSFVHENAKRAPTLVEGQVVGFGKNDEDENFRHIFVVVLIRDWGARLQRLDVDPIDATNKGPLVPLNTLDPNTATRWRFCVGINAKVDSAECIRKSAPGTIFHVFNLKTKNRFSVTESDALPVSRSAVLWVGREVISEGDITGSNWIAIPGKPAPRPAIPRVGIDSTCSFTVPNSTKVEMTAVEHMLSVESEAYRLMVDGLVWCDDDTAQVAVPALHRQFLPSSEPRLQTPAVLSIRPFQLEAAKAQLWVRAAGYMATGDFTFADFLVEKALIEEPSGELSLLSMDLATSASRPESAIRRGFKGTSKSWNRDADPYWNMGMARVDFLMGDKGSYTERMKTVPELALNTNDTELTGFLILSELRQKLKDDVPAQSIALDELLERTSDPVFTKWQLLYRSETIRHAKELEKLDALRVDFQDAEAEAILDGYMGKGVDQPCPEACHVDAYGRRFIAWWEKGPNTADAERTPRARFGPGFRPPSNDALIKGLKTVQGVERLRLATAFARLSPTTKHETVYDVMTQSAVSIADDYQAKRISGPEVMGGLRASLASMVDVSGPLADAEKWLVERGVRALCKSDEDFAQAAALLKKNPGFLHPAVKVYHARIESAQDPKTRLVAMQLGAVIAEKFEGESHCRNWNLSLAIIAAQSGRREYALTHANKAAACAFAKTRETEALIQAYLNYERTLSVSKDYDRVVRQKLLGAVRQEVPKDACAGLVPMNFDVLGVADDEIRKLIKGIELERKKPQELEVVNASDFLYDAQIELESARTAITEGRTDDAVKHFESAASLYSKLGHIPGMKRVAFLQQTASLGKPTKAVKRMMKGEAAAIVSESEAPLNERLMANWLVGGMTQFEKVAAQEQTKLPDSFCK